MLGAIFEKWRLEEKEIHAIYHNTALKRKEKRQLILEKFDVFFQKHFKREIEESEYRTIKKGIKKRIKFIKNAQSAFDSTLKIVTEEL